MTEKFRKMYSIMLKLTIINYRKQLAKVVKDIKSFNDKQILELAYAKNTDIDLKKIANPKLSNLQMRKIRLDIEFSTRLKNVDYDKHEQGIMIGR